MRDRDPMVLHGRVWKFGDNVSMDTFVSAKYDGLGVAGRYAEIVPHILEDVDPTFVHTVQPGDLVVAGREFGKGKHHFSVIGALREVGIAAILAESIDTLCQREAIDAGLPALACQRLPSEVEDGDVLQFDLRTGAGMNVTCNTRIVESRCPPVIAQIIEAGGIRPYTLHRIKRLNQPAESVISERVTE